MCKSISLISGKGGSGKTTLALSMSSILSICGIKTLLIDCDLSTNGATYFYENKLSNNKGSYNSFRDILFEKNNFSKKIKLIKVNTYFDFLPSISKLGSDSLAMYSYSKEDRLLVLEELKQKYDVIIFDCQAGYTDVMKLVLPVSDVNLVVMEGDAISSASMRSLFLKIGDLMNSKKVYQVFNKASLEEYEIYSKVSGGTVFTNIETVRFDWKIRKAFSVSQIPDMENTSADFGKQIFNIVEIILPDEIFKTKLNRFKNKLELNRLIEEEQKTNRELLDIEKKFNEKKGKIRKLVILLIPIFITMVLSITLIIGVSSFDIEESMLSTFVTVFLSIITIIMSYLNYFEVNKERHEIENELKIKKYYLDNIIKKKASVQEKVKDTNRDKDN